MIRRLLAVWPPLWVLAIAAGVYLAFQGLYLYLEIVQGIAPFGLREDTEVLLAIMALLAVGYACFRVAGFHPACRPQYYWWLIGMPWTSAKPLPLGPIHLVWQDALLVALAVGLSWPRAGPSALLIVEAFLGAYLLMLGGMLYYTGQKAWGYATLFGVGFMVWFARELPTYAAITAAVYGITYLGLRASLAAFPWPHAKSLTEKMLNHAHYGANVFAAADRSLGWPYDRLGPVRFEDRDYSWDFKIVFGILMGWWLYVAHVQFRLLGDPSNGYTVFFYFLCFAVIRRLVVYCNGYVPPIDFTGRIMTGRLIIPGYDKIFIAPFLAIVVGIASWYVPRWLEIDPLNVTPIALMLSWWILFAMPPSLRSWRLTGNHRIAPGVMKMAQP